MKIEYSEDKKNAYYDGYSFRRDPRTGYYLSTKPINGRRLRLHVYVWMKETGRSVPVGFHIHHKDADKSHNDISNLSLLSKSEHGSWHGRHLSSEQMKKRTVNILQNAVPASKAWHGSDAGHEWHKRHYEVMGDRLHEKVVCKCKQCGKTCIGYRGTKFCSNNCKSAWRRASGIDDVDKICVECGGVYRANKYANTKYCPLCRDKKHKKGRTGSSLQHAG